MKRYQVDIDPDGYRTREHPNGEWVRAEDAEAESDMLRSLLQTAHDDTTKLLAVVDALPKCEHTRCRQSPNTATWLTFDGWLCDEHESTAPEYQRQQLAYADALRALTR